MGSLKRAIERIIPRALYRALVKPYHLLITLAAACYHRFPARSLTVIAVTGTKGKSTVTEMLFSVLRHAGIDAAVAGTIRFAIKDETRPNLFKMTLPGRGFIQKFLAEARDRGATHAIVEVTSEATLQYRHLFLFLNGLVFTNLQKEHIESHGSFEKYAKAKLEIGKALARSPKRPRTIIANGDVEYSAPFLALPVEELVPFSREEATEVELTAGHASFTYKGVRFSLQLPGGFSVMNALAVAKAAEFLGIPLAVVAEALAGLERIPGRTERIDEGQDFQAVVDYAHTPDSLKALYEAYPGRKICVLGNTGGGRDSWKRPEMGRIASELCDEVLLTNEDPYDEDPRAIVEAMAAGMARAARVVMDRREAIRAALALARPGDAVLITGKGTDPYIMGPGGSKIPWSDAEVVREELKRLNAKEVS
jgi:UDP-N-acetylmuramoyl-L-alanyl-D-glutamate--2,6-diaminopimelate ligase